MVNQYEAVFILTPVLSDTQIKESVEKYEEIIKEAGGEIVQRDLWGLRKLAYPIQKKNTGFYNLVEFKVDSSAIEKLEIAFRRDERVLRFLTVKMEKYHIQFAEKRRNTKKETAKSE